MSLEKRLFELENRVQSVEKDIVALKGIQGDLRSLKRDGFLLLVALILLNLAELFDLL